MITTPIPFELFSEQLSAIHSWPQPAIDYFRAATIHDELPREDWVRIADEWIDTQKLYELERPSLTVVRHGVSTVFNGTLGGIMWENGAAEAEAYAAELNSGIRHSDEIDFNVRWFAVKVEIQFPDSE